MSQAPAKAIYLKDYAPPAFTTKETFLDFELNDGYTLVRSTLSVVRNPKAKGYETEQSNRFVLDGYELELLEVKINDELLSSSDYQMSDTGLVVETALDAFEFSCTTRIYPEKNTALEGLYISGGMYCTQCEAEGFRRITYFQDRPDVLSVFTTRISADAKNFETALSNGNLVNREEKNGRVIAEWHDPFPKPSYLFALVAGDLLCQQDSFVTCSGREIQLQIFVEQGNEHKCEHALESLKRSMKWDEEVYGREYDLDLFMIVAVDHFNMGAMENKGLNVFNSSCVLATPETATDDAFARIEGIVGHEYFHNWSGNRVTCRDWFQLSLKEGFTVFRDAEFSADMGSRAVKRLEDVSFLRQHQFPEDAGPMAHAVRPSSYMEISNFYTVTIYEKGAEVVRMLRTMLGAELFRKGSDLYFDTFDGMAATTDDFVWAMEQVSGRDLTQFKRWYNQAGTPRVTVNRTFNADAGTMTLTLNQQTPESADQSEKKPFVIPVVVGLLDVQGNALDIKTTDVAYQPKECVWLVSEQTQSIKFEGLDDLPIVSLFRDFSAPVLISDDLTDQERITLIGHDSNGFNRWEQCQSIYKKLIIQAVEDAQDSVLFKQLSNSLRSLVLDSSMDASVKAELLQLPSESEFLQLVPNIDILAVSRARTQLKAQLAESLFSDFEHVFKSLEVDGAYRFDAKDVGTRKLKNLLLEFLIVAKTDAYISVAKEQYHEASNMTDQLASFRLITKYADLALADEASEQFVSQWKDDAQVLEQWFRVRVSRSDATTLSRVTGLLEHPLFEYQNPNKVRAVIGAFAMMNVESFHEITGSGYDFLAEQVAKLDSMNPQIAARLVSPLVKWKSYDSARGLRMKSALERLSQKQLSKDLFEVVTKSLS